MLALNLSQSIDLLGSNRLDPLHDLVVLLSQGFHGTPSSSRRDSYLVEITRLLLLYFSL